MMVLLFKVRADRFGLNVINIVEVIPSVPLQKIPKAPFYMAGLLNYRGGVVPVVDLGYLIDEHPVRNCLSSRIIMVRTSNNGRVGLLAESVTETIKINDDEFTDTRIDSEFGWLVDKVVIDSDGMIQHINPDVVIPEELGKLLERDAALAAEDAADVH
ncbi:chemotaxis protein CheW [Pseudomonadota bacterium]